MCHCVCACVCVCVCVCVCLKINPVSAIPLLSSFESTSTPYNIIAKQTRECVCVKQNCALLVIRVNCKLKILSLKELVSSNSLPISEKKRKKNFRKINCNDSEIVSSHMSVVSSFSVTVA